MNCLSTANTFADRDRDVLTKFDGLQRALTSRITIAAKPIVTAINHTAAPTSTKASHASASRRDAVVLALGRADIDKSMAFSRRSCYQRRRRQEQDQRWRQSLPGVCVTHCVGVRVKEISKVTVLVNVGGIEASDIVLWLIMRRCHYVDFE